MKIYVLFLIFLVCCKRLLNFFDNPVASASAIKKQRVNF